MEKYYNKDWNNQVDKKPRNLVQTKKKNDQDGTKVMCEFAK